MSALKGIHLKTLAPKSTRGEAPYPMPNHAPQCRHLFPDNHRCGSPCLRTQGFCYYHHPDRQSPTGAPLAVPVGLRRERRGFQITPPTDRRSLQKALSEVIVRLGANKINPRQASLILYSLQIASRNLSQ
jgi:hypothetical protein